MARPLRFLTTPWGRVAYAEVGDGRPLIFDTGWVGDLEAMWSHGGYRSVVERLAESHRVICFDAIGTGLSERGAATCSLDDEVEVLRLVVDAVGLNIGTRASLFASSIAASTAVRFSVRYPALVDRLVLFGAALRGADLGPVEARIALLDLIRAHWGLGSHTIADIFVPDLDREDRDWFDRLQRASADGPTAARRLQMYYESDITEDASRVSVPTLVLHRQSDRAVRVELGVQVASAIEGAMFEVVPGKTHLCFLGDWRSIIDPVTLFLARRDTASLPSGPFGILTAREVDVAELTMQGLTNAAIGDRLGISPRTVETHLTRIRQKLGVRTRAEVAAWMARRTRVR